MRVSRKRQQADILFALGQFLGPVLKVASNPTGFDEDEKTRILARFFHDANGFNELLKVFCLTGEAGHRYEIQFQQAVSPDAVCEKCRKRGGERAGIQPKNTR